MIYLFFLFKMTSVPEILHIHTVLQKNEATNCIIKCQQLINDTKVTFRVSIQLYVTRKKRPGFWTMLCVDKDI